MPVVDDAWLAHCVRRRKQVGLRTDLAWVEQVAASGRDGGMVLDIPLTESELADMHACIERGTRIGRAVRDADLLSAAGTWIEQEAGGLVHVLLAAPDDAERATAEAIVDGEHAVLDEVAHSTRTLNEVNALVTEQTRIGSPLGAAVVDFGINVTANAVRLRLGHDHDPLIPPRLQAAVTAGTLLIEFTELRWHDQ